MLINAVAIIVSIYAVGDWLAGACTAVLIFVWHMLPKKEGPPVLAAAMTTQWIQVSAGVYYSGLTGRALQATLNSDYRAMVLIGLGCVVALTVGLRWGQRMLAWSMSPRELTLHSLMNTPMLIGVYLASVVATVVLQEIAFRYPTLNQAMLAVSFARLALIYMLLRQFIRSDAMRWDLAGALLVFEIVLGFTGYFSGFKEPLILAGLATLEVFDRRRVNHWAIGGGLIAVLGFACVMWLGVRGEYRQDFQDEVFAASRSARLERIQALITDWWKNRGDRSSGEDLDELIDRVWVVYYPALAVARVPEVLPHSNGELLENTLVHLVTPRVFFPDKPGLPSDSEMVRKYSGVWVAGPEQNTSIAFGYAAESYVDFGVPLMFVPVLVLGVIMGAAYAWFLRVIVHRDVAIALVTCIFWVNLYLFERSWALIVGFGFTMMIYLGLIAFLVDRWFMMRALDELDRSREAAA